MSLASETALNSAGKFFTAGSNAVTFAPAARSCWQNSTAALRRSVSVFGRVSQAEHGDVFAFANRRDAIAAAETPSRDANRCFV